MAGAGSGLNPANAQLIDGCRNGTITTLEQVKELQAQGADIEIRYRGETPLLWAACFSHVQTVSALLQAGANPNAQACYTLSTPLHKAGGNIRITLELISNHADPELTDYEGCSFLTHLERPISNETVSGWHEGHINTQKLALFKQAIRAARRWTPLRTTWVAACVFYAPAYRQSVVDAVSASSGRVEATPSCL